jgi:hypothetical protein
MSTQAPSADYATIGDLLAADDTVQAEIVIWGQRLRVRGLTLEERERVRSPSWKVADVPLELAPVVGYFVYGMVLPPMNMEQAKLFCKKGARHTAQVYRLIENLTELDYADIIAHAEALVALSRPSDTGGTDDGSVLDDPGASVGDAAA